jgi:GNAT superfamily N-acetyltransferase
VTDRVDFRTVDSANADAQDCLAAYFAELRERFEEGFDPGESAAPTLDDFVPPQGLFLVAFEAERPVGCGGFKRLDDNTAYLKRMWVAPEARGQGLGRTLLQALEARALAAGYRRVCLDTHRSLTEARALYERHGYQKTEPLADEPYADHWFVKSLLQ